MMILILLFRKELKENSCRTSDLTVQCGLSSSQPRQKHPALLNCAPRYKNIAKHFINPGNIKMISTGGKMDSEMD